MSGQIAELAREWWQAFLPRPPDLRDWAAEIYLDFSLLSRGRNEPESRDRFVTGGFKTFGDSRPSADSDFRCRRCCCWRSGLARGTRVKRALIDRRQSRRNRSVG